MKLHRLYLGLKDKNGYSLSRDASLFFLKTQLEIRGVLGATIVQGVGVYKGTSEDTLILEVYSTDEASDRKVNASMAYVGRLYAHEFNQESVLHTAVDADVQFLEW